MGQYCAYNIISVQSIALEIPIVTKNSTLDTGKVSQIRLCFILSNFTLYTLLSKKAQ